MKVRLLTEKWSDSMPDWLKHRLVFSKYRGGNGMSVKSSQVHSNRGYYANQAGIDVGRGLWGRHENLFAAANRKGIDLSKVNIIEGPVPENPRTDPRLKDPNIPIFHLVCPSIYRWGGDVETVYMKGINDNERMPNDANDRLFKNVPLKDLLSKTVDFAYIDGSDNPSVNTVRSNRDILRRERANSDSNRVDISKIFSRMDRDKYDKSGYLRNPNRLKNALLKYKSKRYSESLDAWYHDILNIKKDIASYITDFDVTSDVSSSDFLRHEVALLVNDIGACIITYNRAVEDATQISTLQDAAERERRMEDLFSEGYASDLSSQIARIKKKAADITSVVVDWDVFEEDLDETSAEVPIDDASEDTHETIPEGPAPGNDNGIANLLITAINDEWNTIKQYNDMIATLTDIGGFDDMIEVIKDINNEENIHVGQLQECLTKISPNAESIEDGKSESAEVLDNSETPIELEEV